MLNFPFYWPHMVQDARQPDRAGCELQAGGFTDNLVPAGSDLAAEDDEFHIGPLGALRESLATRMCSICPKWPELLKRSCPTSAAAQTSAMYRYGSFHVVKVQHGCSLCLVRCRKST